MAGRGPSPKPSDRKVRRNKDHTATHVIEFIPGVQPDLPEGVIDWPEQTREWWRMWAESPLSESFTQSDWLFLLDTALLHGMLWSGDMSVMPELRIRVAKFGATPEDRARLRIQFADADDKDQRRGSSTSSSSAKTSRERYGRVTKVDFGTENAG
ncbi:hypothetical protein QDX21_07110 [Auritidibacter ignavus]|uniref:Terminase small subunit n=1 Tax=Auritidibacter ignavus TaxID=678932 RepID=A0AAJ6AH05_9MICC|nr:hypothetical protein [Auritidibacter ignavus]WGH92104.1 hypothetical protein QDX21_07110 [Auritidibacter ignavus]